MFGNISCSKNEMYLISCVTQEFGKLKKYLKNQRNHYCKYWGFISAFHSTSILDKPWGYQEVKTAMNFRTFLRKKTKDESIVVHKKVDQLLSSIIYTSVIKILHQSKVSSFYSIESLYKAFYNTSEMYSLSTLFL